MHAKAAQAKSPSTAKCEEWEKLMTQAQLGNGEAYNCLLCDLVKYIRTYCMRKVSYLNIADDVAQEALMAIHKYRHTYDPQKPFLPWLHSIVRHKSIDALRSRHRIMNNELQNEDLLTQMQDSAESTGAERDVHALLQQIPEEFRKPIELMKLQSLSVQDVATRLELNPSTVKMRVHRGLKLLRDLAEGSFNE